ncbi:MAG: phage head-tail connector protein [Sarcina sp.]
MNELLEKLKRRVTNKNDELLMDLLLETIAEVKDFTRQDEYYCTSEIQGPILMIAAAKCNRIGNEGIKQISVSGVSESYEEDLPLSIKKQLYRHRRMRGC